MLQRIRHERVSREGATLDRVRWNEATTRSRSAAAGGGYLARLLAAAVTPGGQVTGRDPSGPANRYARRRALANCSFAVRMAQDMGLPDRPFDVVTSTLAAH